MGFLEYVYKLNLDPLANGESGVKHNHERSFTEAARSRLIRALTPADTREAIREIVANLIGSEESALYEIDYGKAVMWPRWAFGAHCDMQKPVDLIVYPQLNQILQGQVAVYAPPMNLDCFPAPVRALAPITLDESTSGLLVIFSLLPQKAGLNETDKRLLEVISLHGGRALARGPSPLGPGEK